MSYETGFCPRIGEVCELKATYCDDLSEWTKMKQKLEKQNSGFLGIFERFSLRIMPWLDQTPTDWGPRTINSKIYEREALLSLNCNVGTDECIIEQYIEAQEPLGIV